MTLSTDLVAVLTAHRADGWVCTCGWPLTDSVGSVVEHLVEQITPLMRCAGAAPDGLPCRLFPGHSDQHGDGRGTVWDAVCGACGEPLGRAPSGWCNQAAEHSFRDEESSANAGEGVTQ